MVVQLALVHSSHLVHTLLGGADLCTMHELFPFGVELGSLRSKESSHLTQYNTLLPDGDPDFFAVSAAAILNWGRWGESPSRHELDEG
jgi:hypothetical protein